MLGEKIVAKGDKSEDEPLDFAQAWKDSSNYIDLQQHLSEVAKSRDEILEIKYDTEFAVPWLQRDK